MPNTNPQASARSTKDSFTDKQHDQARIKVLAFKQQSICCPNLHTTQTLSFDRAFKKPCLGFATYQEHATGGLADQKSGCKGKLGKTYRTPRTSREFCNAGSMRIVETSLITMLDRSTPSIKMGRKGRVGNNLMLLNYGQL